MRWLFSLVLLASATVTSAGQITFQSGAHDGFTRLVMELPDNTTEWQLNGAGRRYEITVQDDDPEFSTQRVFERIGRDRLADLRPNKADGTVQILLNCVCEVKNSRFGDRFVIFDIFDATSDVEPPKVEPSLLTFGLNAMEQSPTQSLRYIFAEPRLSPATAAPIQQDATVLAVQNQTSPEFSIDRQARMATMQSALLKEIGRAATQDILDPLRNSKPEIAQAKQTITSPPATEMPSAEEAVGSENMAAFNVMDEAGGGSGFADARGRNSSFCLPDAELQIADWGQIEGIDAQISDLRSRLYGEFDELDEVVLTDLARFYVFLTFGAEAENLLATKHSKDDALLVELARLVDGEKFQTRVFRNQGRCQGASTMWAVLAGEKLFEPASVEAAVRTFNGLPRHLRESLAPRLSARFSELGEIEAADIILNAIKRISDEPDPQFQLAQANLAQVKGATEEAQQMLSDVASSGSEMTPVALIELIELHVEQDLPTSGETVALVGAYSVEHKHAELGADLRRAHFLARLQSNEFEPALSILAEISEHDGQERMQALLDPLGMKLAQTAEGFEFVDVMVRHELTDAGIFSAPVSLTVAERFEALGFVAQAKKVLQSAGTLGGSERRRILTAKIALAEGLPRQAEAALLGIPGDHVVRLRASARSLAGDHMAASDMLMSIGDGAEAEQEQWMAGNWDVLADAETDLLRRVAALPQGPVATLGSEPSATVSQGDLALNRTLLSQSQETRTVLADMLKAYSVE